MVENLPRQLENSSLSKSSALGLLGIPGLTAYIGLMEIGKPKVDLSHFCSCLGKGKANSVDELLM